MQCGTSEISLPIGYLTIYIVKKVWVENEWRKFPLTIDHGKHTACVFEVQRNHSGEMQLVHRLCNACAIFKVKESTGHLSACTNACGWMESNQMR